MYINPFHSLKNVPKVSLRSERQNFAPGSHTYIQMSRNLVSKRQVVLPPVVFSSHTKWLLTSYVAKLSSRLTATMKASKPDNTRGLERGKQKGAMRQTVTFFIVSGEV